MGADPLGRHAVLGRDRASRCPGVTALLIVNLAFGVVSRAAPSLNLFAVGFPVSLVVGLLVVLAGIAPLQKSFIELLGRASSSCATSVEASAMAESGQERTEQATPKRLEEARKKGQVPRSVGAVDGGGVHRGAPRPSTRWAAAPRASSPSSCAAA